jgi:hypothetical protein
LIIANDLYINYNLVRNSCGVLERNIVLHLPSLLEDRARASLLPRSKANYYIKKYVSVVIFSTCDKIFEMEIKKKNLTDVSNQINQPPYLLIN